MSCTALCSPSFLTWLPAGPDTENTQGAPGSFSSPFWNQRQVLPAPGAPKEEADSLRRSQLAQGKWKLAN